MRLFLKLLLLLGFVAGSAGATANSYYPVIGEAMRQGYKDVNSLEKLRLTLSEGQYSTVTGISNAKSSNVSDSTQIQWRVFVPPGSRFMTTSYFTAQRPASENKLAIKFRAPPVTTAGQITKSSAFGNIGKTFERLLSGDELTFYTEVGGDPSYLTGAGTVLITQQNDELNADATVKGGWLYFNAMAAPNNTVQRVEVNFYTRANCYEAWFKEASAPNGAFGTDGNPIEFNSDGSPYAPTVTIGTDGSCTSVAGPQGPVLTSISLTPPAVLTAGAVSNQPIAITPFPSDASLGNCLASASTPSNLMNIVAISGGVITLGANSSTVTRQETVAITCNGITATSRVTINPATPTVVLTGIELSKSSLVGSDTTTAVTVRAVPEGAVLPGACQAVAFGMPSSFYVAFKSDGSNQFTLKSAANEITENKLVTIECGSERATATFTITVPLQILQVETDGKLELQVPFKPDFSGTASGTKKARIWIVAQRPKNELLKLEELYFYLREDRTWGFMGSLAPLDLDQIRYKEISPVLESQTISVFTGAKKDDLNALGAVLYFVYQVEGGPLTLLGKIYPR